MRWRSSYIPTGTERRRSLFAWLPVRIPHIGSGEWVWLEAVTVREVKVRGGGFRVIAADFPVREGA